MNYDNIWRDAFLKASPVFFNMVCVLFIALAPLYLILKTQQQMTHILSTTEESISKYLDKDL
tara:strand:- start:25 stop:210 length:186 start_codon:yes stop_codon:yes gene_type:complete